MAGCLRPLRARPERHSTRIGHDCRDAITAFAGELARLHNVAVEPAASTAVKTVRAVFDAQPDMRKRVREFLKALLAYWGTLIDLAMRQDHPVSRARSALTADDSRRLVFQTLMVMVEIDRALKRPAGSG